MPVANHKKINRLQPQMNPIDEFIKFDEIDTEGEKEEEEEEYEEKRCVPNRRSSRTRKNVTNTILTGIVKKRRKCAFFDADKLKTKPQMSERIREQEIVINELSIKLKEKEDYINQLEDQYDIMIKETNNRIEGIKDSFLLLRNTVESSLCK